LEAASVKIGNIVIILALTCVWVLLLEGFTVAIVLSGLFFGTVVLVFCNRALPMGKVHNVRFTRLAMYPLFLIGQIYLAGFHVVKLIFTGAEVEIIDVKTDIENESLRILLVDSVTLTPGSILLGMRGQQFSLLWLKGKKDNALSTEERDYAIKGRLEDWLIKAQK